MIELSQAARLAAPRVLPIGESAREVLAARRDASNLTPFPVGRIAR